MFPLIRFKVAMAGSEYGSLDRTAHTMADLPVPPRNGFMLRIICCCSAELSCAKRKYGIGWPDGDVTPYTFETPFICRVEFSAYNIDLKAVTVIQLCATKATGDFTNV